MKKLLTLWMLILLPYCIGAQTDIKAEEILDKVLKELSENNGVRADFTGSEDGYLLLKGKKFYLNSSNIQSWYDGKTQWSYITDAEEVNISLPTPEELQGINPYFILMGYKINFNYIYKGQQTRNGTTGHEIVLTSKHSGNRDVIRLFISSTYRPLSIKMEQNGRIVSEININNYQTNLKLGDEIFRFNKSLYPNAEIIDLR